MSSASILNISWVTRVWPVRDIVAHPSSIFCWGLRIVVTQMYALWESFHISIRKPRFGATHFIPQVAVHGNKESYKVADNKICISDYRGRVRDQLRTNIEINADQLRIDIEVNAEINWKLQIFRISWWIWTFLSMLCHVRENPTKIHPHFDEK